MDEKVTKVNIQKKGNIDRFNERLKQARIAAGFTSQDVFAEKVGVNRVTINYYEQGIRKPDIEVFIKIADALNVSYDYLLGYSDTPIRENHDVREITGLSDKAIEVLKKEAVEAKRTPQEIDVINEYCKKGHQTLNYLLENDLDYFFFNNLGNYLWFKENHKRLFELNAVSTDEDFGYTMSPRQWEMASKIYLDETIFAIKSDIEKANGNSSTTGRKKR